jgi:hypothetical protein
MVMEMRMEMEMEMGMEIGMGMGMGLLKVRGHPEECLIYFFFQGFTNS